MLIDLKDKVAIVTGAGRGIGNEIARTLAAEGAIVVVTDIRQDLLDETAAEWQRQGWRGMQLLCDVRKAEDNRAVVAAVDQAHGRIDILVNNAGASWAGPAQDYPVAAWDKVMNLNIRGYFILSQHVAKRWMIDNGGGRIINIASISGLGANPPDMPMIAYNTSKGAVVNFTRALASEWGRYRINVNALCPGFFPSKLSSGAIKAFGEDRLASHAPLGRLGDDEDLKGVTLLFASDAGKHITGQYLAVDGGVSIVTGG